MAELPTKRLTLAELAADTFGAFGRNAPLFLKALPLPFLAYYALNRLAVWLDTVAVVGVLTTLAAVFAVVTYMVACHRIVLINDRTAAALTGPRLGKREVIFFVHVVLIALILTPGLMVIVSVARSAGGSTINPAALVFGLAGIVVLMIVATRMAMVLPTIALGRWESPITNFAKAWALTRGAVAALVGGSILVTLAVSVATFILANLLAVFGIADPRMGLEALAAQPIAAFLNTVVEFLTATLMACLMSAAHIKLSQRPSTEQEV